MTVLRIDHVQLAMPAGEEPAAVAFYDGLLGLGNVAKPAHLAARGGCWFEAGSTKVHLGVEADFRPARKAHPALLVDDLGALSERLEAAGFPVRDGDGVDGFTQRYVDDPFGNRIELLEDTQPH
jgi:catechol 2,3-dioxygenase-like lactoylglutathione lyase family enzyme